MNRKLNSLLNQLAPFIGLGIAIAFFIGLIVMFSYLFIWGVIIGSIIWLVMVIKNYFFPPAKIKKTEGRIIDHDKK